MDRQQTAVDTVLVLMCAALALAAAVAVDVGQDAPLHANMRSDCGAGVPCTMHEKDQNLIE